MTRFAPRSLLALLALVLLTLGLAAAPRHARVDELSPEQRQAVVERLAEELEARYVFPEVAAECGERLFAELGAGALDAARTRAEFATLLTGVLQDATADLHIRVWVRERPPTAEPAPEESQEESQEESPALDASGAEAAGAGAPEPDSPEPDSPEPGAPSEAEEAASLVAGLTWFRSQNYGFECVERLPGNVGYVDLRGFRPVQFARATGAAAMQYLADSDALVFDLRQNGGGSPDMVQFLCSYFFAEPTHLNSLYWREGDVTEEFWTVPVPGPVMGDVPLYVLTSANTFSGAEEFAYNLRTRERATLVGRTTGGGANPGGSVVLDEHFEVFIPTGRAINPVTGTNWEGVGVVPHLDVPAEEALERALELARPAALAYRDAKAARQAAIATDVVRGLRAAGELLGAGGSPAEGRRAVRAALQPGFDSGLLGEGPVDMLAHEALWRGQTELTLAILEVNTERYPGSFAAWQSLARVTEEAGDRERAIELYETCLALHPENPALERRIASLRD